MFQPDTLQLNRLMATVEELRLAEARAAELKAKLSEEAHALAAIDDTNQRLASAIYAYWYAPEVAASDLAFGATGQAHASALLKVMGPASIAVPCDRCKADLPIRSRNEMKAILGKLKKGQPSYTEGFRVLCDDCWSEVQKQRSVEYAAARRARSQAVAALRALPYANYLETEAWEHRRNSFLWFYLKEKSSFRCETCDAPENLGTYHSTLDHLGDADRLVLLCQTCVGALLDAGKIVGPPGPRNLLSGQDAKLIRDRFNAEQYGE